MALIKKPEEIESMRRGGALLSRALQAAVDAVKPGVVMRILDDIATEVIVASGGTPSFKGYKSGGPVPFPSTMCISVNEEVVHGIGGRDIVLKEGDIVGMDIGCWFEGLCTDMAVTVPVGSVSPERMKLMRLTRDVMHAGVAAALVGHKVFDIGAAAEDATPKGYGIVKALVGHGVGHAVHESPHVPNYRGNKKQFPEVLLKPGMCLAIEPMITLGTDQVKTGKDGWTIVTSDGSDAAHFEVTIAITDQGPELLTPEPKIRI